MKIRHASPGAAEGEHPFLNVYQDRVPLPNVNLGGPCANEDCDSEDPAAYPDPAAYAPVLAPAYCSRACYEHYLDTYDPSPVTQEEVTR